MEKKGQREAREERKPSAMSFAYTFLYNFIQTAGWTMVGVRQVQYYLDGNSHQPGQNLWGYISVWLIIFQSLAVMEIVHSVLGIVRSPFITTFIQVLSRLLLLWGVAYPVKETHNHFVLSTMVASWTITEVVRYGYYCFKLLEFVPYPLEYLRYTLFYVLYPSGAGSEYLLIMIALPAIKKSGLFSVFMPNALNFSFDYYWFLFMLAMSYLPLFPKMYLHMVSQRKKVIGSAP